MSRLARKKNPPVSSTMEEAEYIGLRLMTEAEYSHPKNLGEFDLKTSSWIDTPQELRSKGAALFCERSYGREFTFHNGAIITTVCEGLGGLCWARSGSYRIFSLARHKGTKQSALAEVHQLCVVVFEF